MKRRFLCAVPQAAGAAVLLAAFTAAPALALEPAPQNGARDRAARQTRARAPLDLVLLRVGGKTVTPKSTVSVSGYVQNQSGQPLTGLSVRLRHRGTPLRSRGEVEQYAGATPPQLPLVARSVQVQGALQTKGRSDWRLAAKAESLGMRDFGIYPIAIDVVNGAGVPIASRTTFLVFNDGRTRFQRTEVAWVWPVIDRPHRAGDSTFLDDRLAGDLGQGGRLDGLVKAAANPGSAPVTWAVDPALLDDARTLTQPYTVRTYKGGKVAKETKMPASEAAKQWLAQFRTASEGDPFFAVPYADPDPVALVGNRMRGHLNSAYEQTELVADEDLMGRAPSLSIAWPPAGAADQATLDQLARKDEVFLLNGQVLPSADQTQTPSATTTLEAARKQRTVLAYDDTLNRVVSGDTRSPGSRVLAEQRFLAETAMITAEAPNRQRTLVIAPNHRWNPDPQLAANLLAYTKKARWMKAVPLEEVIGSPPQQRTFIGYPSAFRQRDLPERYLRRVREIGTKATNFSSIFKPSTDAYERAVLRTESSWWRSSTFTAVKVREIVNTELDRDIGKIRILSKSRIGLAGNSGKMPISIANELRSGTVTIRVTVTSLTQARLRTGRPDREQVTLAPKQIDTLYVPLQAYANGDTDVEVEFLTPDGKRFVEPTKINVRTTGYGRTALLITGGGLAVLFLGVGLRVMRAKRRNGAEGSSDGRPAGGASSPGGDASEPALDGGTAAADGRADSAGDDSPIRSSSGTDTGSTPA